MQPLERVILEIETFFKDSVQAMSKVCCAVDLSMAFERVGEHDKGLYNGSRILVPVISGSFTGLLMDMVPGDFINPCQLDSGLIIPVGVAQLAHRQFSIYNPKDGMRLYLDEFFCP